MSPGDFVAACHDIQRERRTGVLEVRADQVRTFLYFKEGALVFAEAGSLGATLGRILVQQGILGQEQYAAILTRMTEGLIHNEQVRFGEIAVQLGYLTAQQVDDALREQVRRKFVHCMQWTSPRCRFVEGEDEVAHLPAYRWGLEPLVFEGVREHFDEYRYALILEPAEAFYPTLREDAQEVARRFLLDARGLRFLRALDGTRTIEAQLASPQGAELRPLLVALMISNAVRLTVAPAPRGQAAPAEGAEDSVIVFLPAAPPTEGVTATPPSPAAAAPPRETTATAPAAPPSVQVKAARLEAEQAYQAGKKHLAADEWPAAARELRRAATLYPEVLEYQVAAVWAEFRAGGGEGDWRDRRAQLKELAARAINQDATMPLPHHALGHVLAMEGDDTAARRELRAALRLDPGNLEVERQLRVLARRSRDRAEKGAPIRGSGGRKGEAGDVARVLEHATVARSSGQAGVAVTLLRNALGKAPGHAEITAELALALLQQDPGRNAREANALAREARKADPQLPLPWVVIGMLLGQIGQADRAALMIRHALELDPECSEAQHALEALGKS